MASLKDKDTNTHLNKAQERMTMQSLSDTSTPQAELHRKKRKRQTKLEGTVPIPAAPIQSVAAVEVDTEQMSTLGSAKDLGSGQRFEGEREIQSLWDKRFPMGPFVRDFLLKKDYSQRMRNLSLNQGC